MTITALALVCTLKPSPEKSSSELLARQVLDALAEHDVTGEVVRVVDFDIKPGVEHDMGNGDEWPVLREKVLAADILLISTPTWMGHPSSVTHRVLERLDADIAEKGDDGNPVFFGKVGIVAAVGNEDGAHLIAAEVFQALDDVGFTIPAKASTYWNDVAMGERDYLDLKETPKTVQDATDGLARTAAHLASLLKKTPYPAE
ncbi:NAD(P)H-dependent oxidoreductase [soil metagenome]